MQISSKGVELIKSFESYSKRACKCRPQEKYYTYGYGHYGSDVAPNATISKSDAEKLLIKDLQRHVIHVNEYMNVYHFTQNQFDAMVSFSYNVGNIKQLTKDGTRTLKQISDHILAYNKCGGEVLQGLTNRRKKEKELFDSDLTQGYIYFNSAEKYKGYSIVDALKYIGEPITSLNYRRKIAKLNGIDTKDTTYMNSTMLRLLKQGILRKAKKGVK